MDLPSMLGLLLTGGGGGGGGGVRAVGERTGEVMG